MKSSHRFVQVLRGNGLIVVSAATLAASTGNYALSILAARSLVPSDFGAFAAVLGLLAIFSTIGLAAQATVARETAENTGTSFGSSSHRSMAKRLFLVTLALMILISPVSAYFLSVPYIEMLLMLLTVPFTVVSSTLLGRIQGKQTHGYLAIAIFNLAFWRVLIGGLFLVLSPTLMALAFGLFCGAVIAALVILLMLFGDAHKKENFSWPQIPPFVIVLQALSLMFILSNMDIVLARLFLSPDLSGVYAVGSLLTKIVFFLPSPILIILYPRMANQNAKRFIATAALATMGISAIMVILAIGAPRFILDFLAGDKYFELQPILWVFALAGGALATLQVAVYGRLARKDKQVIYLLWSGVIVTALLIAIFGHVGPQIIVSIVAVSAIVQTVLVLLGEFSWREERSIEI